ncbi:DUF3841 domain-containing protein [Clostridioides difficile]|uniref:DUF3841 domain-containing protein n=1 Tax=Clostridioides difficile TaxID=1496 RepID=UPI0021CA9923|nr:DUF3841 domain-containing protein [Clostridioides difficile]UUV14482.1 DUF3841 domain-containing protein [Clostridioides difficile]
MKFYTIQTLEFWNNNKNNKYLSNDYSLIVEDFDIPYKWMYSQMIERIPKFDDSMIWVWSKRPDLRCSAYLERGSKGVLLEIEISEDNVLLSEFDLWHLPLMDIAVEIYEDEQIEKKVSWERIFDLELCSKLNEVNIEDLTLQGVTSKVPLSNVRLIKEFVAK